MSLFQLELRKRAVSLGGGEDGLIAVILNLVLIDQDTAQHVAGL